MTDDMDLETSGQETPDTAASDPAASGGSAWDLLGDEGADTTTDAGAGHGEGAGFGTRMPDRELGDADIGDPGEGSDFDLGGTGSDPDTTDDASRGRD